MRADPDECHRAARQTVSSMHLILREKELGRLFCWLQLEEIRADVKVFCIMSEKLIQKITRYVMKLYLYAELLKTIH